DGDPRAAPPRRERVEREEPLHRLGRRRPDREGPGRGRPRRHAAAGRRRAAGRAAHLAAAPGDQDRRARPGGRRAVLAAGPPVLAAQRAPLRRAAGPGQGGHPGEVRRRAVHALAPVVRRAPAAAGRRRRVVPGRRPAVRRPARPRAAHRVPGRRGRPDAAVLVRRAGPGPAAGPHGAGRRARQLPARPGQAPGRAVRGGRRGPEHPDRHPAAVRAGPGHPDADQPGRGLPRPGRGRRRHRGGQEPGQV
ncbi:MAG: Phosphoglycerate mutase, partial [uncultured Corynebacteriales bacterium]